MSGPECAAHAGRRTLSEIVRAILRPTSEFSTDRGWIRPALLLGFGFLFTGALASGAMLRQLEFLESSAAGLEAYRMQVMIPGLRRLILVERLLPPAFPALVMGVLILVGPEPRLVSNLRTSVLAFFPVLLGRIAETGYVLASVGSTNAVGEVLGLPSDLLLDRAALLAVPGRLAPLVNALTDPWTCWMVLVWWGIQSRPLRQAGDAMAWRLLLPRVVVSTALAAILVHRFAIAVVATVIGM